EGFGEAPGTLWVWAPSLPKPPRKAGYVSRIIQRRNPRANNPMAYSSKDAVLDVVRTERGRFYDVIDKPDNWMVDTRCEGWQVRDLVGHMIDVTESYLTRWDMARKDERPQGIGWLTMASELNN